MGIRGLTKFINQREDVFMKKYYLHDTKLVIDGINICCDLCRSVDSFSAYGGDYDKIATNMKTLFENLHKCNVTPYIIIDGCHESRKLKSVFNRLKPKLDHASQPNPVNQDNQVLPYMLRDVFREVLVQMKISYTVCEFKADYEIAALARYLNCPVLSNDSDFFIYNALYIPFNTLELKVKQNIIQGNEVNVMECKLYKVQYLCDHVGIREEVLPLAIVLGNDFVESEVFHDFFAQLPGKRKGSRWGDYQMKYNQQKGWESIQALFNWLKNKTLDSATSTILQMVKEKSAADLIKQSVREYHSNHCKSLKYFNIKDDKNSENEDDQENVDRTLETLPKWFAEKIRKKLVPTVYMNLYTHKLHIWNPQAEDFHEEESFSCVWPILRYAFDILTDFCHGNCYYVTVDNQSRCKKLPIGKEYSVARPLNKPFEQVTEAEIKLYFKHFLDLKLHNLDFALIDKLPSNFQLYMISILWWISNCNVPEAHVHSLIMSYIMLEVIDEKIGTVRGEQFERKHHKKLEELRQKSTKNIKTNKLIFRKSEIGLEDCIVAGSVLLKHFELENDSRKRKETYDIKKIHSFAQFQCSLQQINALNTLCLSPFENTIISKSYNGTFIYNIASKLENQSDPARFLEQYMKGATTVIQFYKSVCSIYNKLLKKMHLSTAQWPGKRRRIT